MLSLSPLVVFRVQSPAARGRLHLLIRIVLLLALGSLGWSSIYWLLYLTIPALVALIIITNGAQRFIAESAPGIVRLLRWLAGAYAYLWMLTDVPPGQGSPDHLTLAIVPSGEPTAVSAILRIIYSIPAAILLMLLSFAAGWVWVIGAVAILFAGQLPEFANNFIALTLRYQFRLLAYHCSLVDRYPSFEG